MRVMIVVTVVMKVVAVVITVCFPLAFFLEVKAAIVS